MKNNSSDITKEGVAPLKGIRGEDLYEPSLKERIQANYISSARRAANAYRGNLGYEHLSDPKLITPEESALTLGQSVYDPALMFSPTEEKISNNRADEQPWYLQLGAGIAKAASLAATTFLDGTIGLVFGIVEAARRGEWSGLWDNDFSKALKGWNDMMEDQLTNYYSTEELQGPWYKNILTTNFIGDKFIKNLGFTVGAYYSGKVLAAPLKLTGLGGKGGSAVHAVSSALNEGRIEALNNSTDWYDLHKMQLDDKYQRDLQSALEELEANKGHFVGNNETGFIDPAYDTYKEKVAKIDQAYSETLSRLDRDRKRMGNADLLMNIPILTASNVIQFGKLMGRGFSSSKKVKGSLQESRGTGIQGSAATGYKAEMSSLAAKTGGIRGSLSEGAEEMLQSVASNTAGTYYETDINNFYKAKIDPEAEQETLDWIKSFGTALAETISEGSSWEEFFIGALTGALGMPRFSKRGITLENNIISNWKEAHRERAEQVALADKMNEIIQSPERLNYYQGAIRRTKMQNLADEALDNNDQFTYENATHSQLVSDIAMFKRAGKEADLIELVSNALNTSDENLQAIIENTTTETEDGKKVGPWIDSKGNPVTNTPEGKQKMIDTINKNREDYLSLIKEYSDALDYIEGYTNGRLNDDQLEELAWMKTQLSNWTKRAESMSGEVKDAIGIVQSFYRRYVESLLSARDLEGATNKERTPLYDELDKKLRTNTNTLDFLNSITGLSPEAFTTFMTSKDSARLIDGIVSIIEGSEDTSIDKVKKEEAISRLKDLQRLGRAYETLSSKMDEYLTNPDKQLEDHVTAVANTSNTIEEKNNASLRQKLDKASSVSEFRQILNDEQDTNVKESVLKAMESEGNQMAKNYKETLQYNNEISKALNGLGETDQVSQDAMTLWQEQFNTAENLEQLANPNSIYINNEDAFLEDSEGDVDMAGNRFQSARYALQRAMSKVNNDIRFKNRFSEEYRRPVDESIRGKGIDKDSTGDSETSTVPYVNPNATPVETPSVPVGNVTAEMVATENREANRRVETQRSLDQSQQGQRRYYRPAIPELHIEASKEGDFRPFDVVVAERESGVDFSSIYNYLRDNGAFSYVNAARIKPGDTLGFMIDPEFNDHTIFLIDTRNNQIVGSIDESDVSVARYEGLEEVIKKVRDEYQASINKSVRLGRSAAIREGLLSRDSTIGRIVHSANDATDGSKLSPLEAKVVRKRVESILLDSEATTEGMMNAVISNVHHTKAALPELHFLYKVQKAVKEGRMSVEEAMDIIDIMIDQDSIKGKEVKETPTGKFFATPQTRVSKIMVGRIPFTSEERSLADIPGVLDGSAKPVFGIIKNGTLTTNEKIDDRLIIKPVDMAQKEGRLYLLIPNAAGTYSPAAVRVKHFNNQEFNLDDPTVANTKIGQGINEAINKLSSITSKAEWEDDAPIAMKELAQDLYMQDVMITWFDSDAGSGIVIGRKVRKPDGTYEMVNINGQEQIKENKYTIYYQNSKDMIIMGGMEVFRSSLEEGIKNGLNSPEQLAAFGQPRDMAEIRRDILNTILGFNLPIQVSASRINDSGYNNRVIKSNVLTSNLREAKVIGSWFTTDYFDKQGNLQRSVSPSSVKPAPSRRTTTPVGGTEGVIQGTSVRIGNSSYTVDLKTMVYTDSNGAKYAATTSNANIFAMAWAQENFGDSTESSVMTENKVITPQGKVLDRNTGTYVSDAEAKRIKDKIAGSNQAAQNRIAESKRVIADIYENQKRVDKARTDSDYYYILEDDGQYHEYSRVHSRLGDNWLGERTETENSRKALEAGTAVDKVIRDFFTSKETPVKPDTLSESAFISLLTKLTEIKSKMEQLGETFMADNIVLFQKYADGTRVAGEVDILSVDKNGNFKIYDVKTSRYSFEEKRFSEKWGQQVMSTKDYYTLQLSAYQNLFESQYGVRPTKLAILPFVLTYGNGGQVAEITQQKGIKIDYNPAVNVPLASTARVPSVDNTLPIFDSTIETMITEKDQDRVLPENAFEEGGEIGYYEKDGKLYSGYLKRIGEVEATLDSGQKVIFPIHVTKVRDRGFGREGELGATSEYLTVFENGKAISTKTNSASDTEAASIIMKALTAKPDKVAALSSEKTQIHNPRELEELDYNIRSTQYSQPSAQPSGAATTIQREDSINNHDEEFEDELDLGELRRVDDSSRELWNQEKELAWIKKVLPQLSEQDRIRVVKGLIQVAENGPVAWGMFSNGIVTLSDIAAEGTTYHEAFHVVFNLMMNDTERETLFNEARQMFGTKSLLELEEDMAEGFREYVASQESRNIGRKILDFFKNLFAKVTNWKYVKPSLISYYRMINQGKYKTYNLGQSPISTNNDIRYRTVPNSSWSVVDNETRQSLVAKGWTQEKFDSISQKERDQAVECVGL